jgi:hypothetical protein
MKLTELENAVRTHAGEFHCERIHDPATTKVVHFAHLVEPATDVGELPPIGRLAEFYATFGSVAFYHDEVSGDAARHLAAPQAWDELRAGFAMWWEDLDEDELAEFAPEWFTNALVIGETPHSGNYILMATEGAATGQIYEFDHDGYETDYRADDVVQYVEKLLAPDGARLTDFASHQRFIEPGSDVQWWIREMRDNRGHTASTR